MKTSSMFAVTSIILASSFAAAPAFAYIDTKTVERRMARQADRIDQGVRSGELTRSEVRHLRQEQNKIARTFRRFCNDDHFSSSERRTMRRLLNDANRHIYAEKNNSERRYANRRSHGHGQGHNGRDQDYNRNADYRDNDRPWYRRWSNFSRWNSNRRWR